MKLADLRKQLRLEGAPLAEFVPEPPAPTNVDGPIKGRKADVAIIDDPLVDDEREKRRADFRTEVLGEWIDEPAKGSLPPTLTEMLEDGTVTWDNSKESRISGQIMYFRPEGELVQVKGKPTALGTGMARVWYGKRDERGQPVLYDVCERDLYAVQTLKCGCGGDTMSVDRRGRPQPPCSRCDGLGVYPRPGALAPFKGDEPRSKR